MKEKGEGGPFTYVTGWVLTIKDHGDNRRIKRMVE